MVSRVSVGGQRLDCVEFVRSMKYHMAGNF